eukprot:RCo050918
MAAAVTPERSATVQFEQPQKSLVRELPPVNAIPKQWKHSGWPGSIRATRLDYESDQSAFASTALLTPEKRERKSEVQSFKSHRRLGRRPQWESSVAPPSRFPDRAMMHTISEFQSIRPVHNYRAATVPQLYHTTAFLPHGGKFTFARAAAVLHPDSDHRTVVSTNVSLSDRVEFTDPNATRGPSWNCSTLVSKDRTAEERLLERAKRGAKACSERLLQEKGYAPPRDRVAALNNRLREARAAAALQRSAPPIESEPQTFTLSKMRAQKAREEAAAKASLELSEQMVQPQALSSVASIPQ